MSQTDTAWRVPAFKLPAPMIVDGCRLDTMVMGPGGDMVRPHLVVIITPAEMPGPYFSYKLQAWVDDQFREMADTLRDVLERGQ
jgi:hypothetical protein